MSRVPDRIPPGPIKLTYEDYVDLPDDGRRYEILDGELEVSPAPAPRHQAVLGNLFWILHGHVHERGSGRVYCAPIDVILAPTSVVQPDLIFIAAGRESIVTERAIEGPFPSPAPRPRVRKTKNMDASIQLDVSVRARRLHVSSLESPALPSRRGRRRGRAVRRRRFRLRPAGPERREV